MKARTYPGLSRFAGQADEAIVHVEDLMATCRHWLTDEACVLVAWFKDEKARLQAAIRDRNGRLPPGMYAPLNLQVKGGGDTPLELYWARTTFNRRMSTRPRSTYLKRGKDKTLYPEAALKRYAKPYEWSLVLEAEERAEVIRRRWKWATRIEAATRGLDIDVAARAKFGRQQVPQAQQDDPALQRLVADGHMERLTPEDLRDTRDRFVRVDAPPAGE